MLQCICSETSTLPQLILYIRFTCSSRNFLDFPASLYNHRESCFAARRRPCKSIFPRQRGKKDEEEKPRGVLGFVHVCWIRARPLSGVSPPLAKASPPPQSLSRTFPLPSSLPHAGFLRSEACVRVSPSRSSPRIHRPRLREFLGLRRSFPRQEIAIRNLFAHSSLEEGTLRKMFRLSANNKLQRNKMHSDHTNNPHARILIIGMIIDIVIQ